MGLGALLKEPEIRPTLPKTPQVFDLLLNRVYKPSINLFLLIFTRIISITSYVSYGRSPQGK